jgi:hypothetical protein
MEIFRKVFMGIPRLVLRMIEMVGMGEFLGL